MLYESGQALMRPVAMMTPDLAMIAEVILAAEGFREARVLAKKTVTLYSLMTQQLSKQVRNVPLCSHVPSIAVATASWLARKDLELETQPAESRSLTCDTDLKSSSHNNGSQR